MHIKLFNNGFLHNIAISAAKLQQIFHICKRSGVFSSNKMKFYGLNGHMGRLCSHKNDL